MKSSLAIGIVILGSITGVAEKTISAQYLYPIVGLNGQIIQRKNPMIYCCSCGHQTVSQDHFDGCQKCGAKDMGHFISIK